MMCTRIADYCKKQGMSLQEYQDYKENVDRVARNIYADKVILSPSGLHFPTEELLEGISDEQEKLFVIQSLKKLGVEFYDNSTLWRY